MKVLITGSRGFIGSALISELEKNSLLDLLCLSSDNSIQHTNPKGISYIFADLSKSNFVDSLPMSADVIVHLAQSKHYRDFPEKANDIFNVNIQSTQLLLDWALKAGVKKFIYASSGNVYKPLQRALIEKDTCEPPTYYGSSKYAAENIITPYSKYFETIVLRIFGVYGPGQKNMTIPNIIKKMQTGENIILAGGVGLYFTPLYIDDCVNVMRELIERKTPLKNKIYNLGGVENIKLSELISLIASINHTQANITTTNDEPMYLMADASNLFNEIGIGPLIKIKEGITKTIKNE